MQDLIKSKIKEVQDWPQKGVSFKDITPLLQDRQLFSRVVDLMALPYADKKIDKVVGIDARGFILASALAYKLNSGLAIIRKKGKLPRETVSKNYSLEYASNEIELHRDAILPGEKILLVDDVLATGGTAAAALDLIKELGGEVAGVEFLIELCYLNGREKIKEHFFNSLIKYGDETILAPVPEKKLGALPLKIGVIGGSGFYDFFSAQGGPASGRGEASQELEIETEFGKPSDKITFGNLFGKEIYFLPRHGKGHKFPPHKIPYKANIAAFKKLGVEVIIAPAAVGSLKAGIKPGDYVICDQFVNRTSKRDDTFFDGPEVAHIESAHPFCKSLKGIAIEQGQKLGLSLHPKGTVVVIEGPRFSTLAESMWFSKMGWDLVNMTQYPEVALAAEMGICYLNVSLVTDYDAGIYSTGQVAPVSIGQVLENFKNNNEKLKKFILAVVENLPEERFCDCKLKSERAKI